MSKKSIVLMLLIILLFSCSHKEEMVYVDDTWEPELLMQKGNEYLQQEDYEHAFEAFETIYNKYPTSRLYTNAVLGIAYIFGKTEQYEKQMDMIHSLVKENIVPTKIPAIYNQIGEFYEKTSVVMREINPYDTTDLHKAVEYYTKATSYPLSSDSSSISESHYKIALLQFQLGHKEKGLASLNKLIKDFPGSPWSIQARNFINNYEETGILPGYFTEEAVDTTNVAPEENSGNFNAENNVNDAAEPEIMPDSSGIVNPSDSVMTDTTEIKKSILEEIPEQKSKQPANIDSLLNKIK